MLKHLTGRSYCLETPGAVLGIYLEDDRHCLLIDSGEAAHGPQVVDILKEQGWIVSALINTHAHADHCGANRIIAEAFAAPVYASALEKVFLENPELIPYTLFSAHPPRSLANRFIMPPVSPPAQVIEPGSQMVSCTPLDIVDLSGHTPGQIGIITPDGVLFAGDSLISDKAYSAFPCPVVVDVQKQLASLDRLQETSYNALCISHGGRIEQASSLLDRNREWLRQLIDEVVESLPGRPMSREEITGRIIAQRELTVNTTQYYLVWSTVSAVISYLLDHRLITALHQPTGIAYISK